MTATIRKTPASEYHAFAWRPGTRMPQHRRPTSSVRGVLIAEFFKASTATFSTFLCEITASATLVKFARGDVTTNLWGAAYPAAPLVGDYMTVTGE
jgi:hypothetical protein